MSKTKNFLAIDLGASSGRVMLGKWDGDRFRLREIHRFPNHPVEILGHLHWDVLHLWSEIKTGLTCYASQYKEPPTAIGVDAWGVDYALLDNSGRLLGNPYHYRDQRIVGMMDKVFEKVSPSWIYERTGIQFMPINTLYQLYSMVASHDPQLKAADQLLMIPDLFHYWLSSEKAAEYTAASTTQLLNALTGTWDNELCQHLGLPTHCLPAIVPSGTRLGELLPGISAEVGFYKRKDTKPISIITPGSHDTASAVAAIPEMNPDSIYISSGTWSLVGIELPAPLINPQAQTLNFTNEGGIGIDGETRVRFLKNVAGLWLLQECRRQWQAENQSYSWEELLSLAEQAAPTAPSTRADTSPPAINRWANTAGSLINPDAPEFLTPGDMTTKILAFCKHTDQPEPTSIAEIVRSILESLALKYRLVIESLEILVGRKFETIRLVGGGSLNHLLNQFSADACGIPVVAGPVEATALGNLMVQAISSGCLANIQEGRQVVANSCERLIYSPQRKESWDQAYERFKKIL